MENREKVIVTLAGIALVYGVFQFLPSSSGPKNGPADAQKHLDALNKLVTDVSLSLAKDAPDQVTRFIISTAEADWTKDPFLDRRPAGIQEVEEKPDQPTTDMTFVYSGYLEMDGKKICIVNGMEYESGEKLTTGEYVVRQIEPQNVILEAEADGQKIVVPFQE